MDRGQEGKSAHHLDFCAAVQEMYKVSAADPSVHRIPIYNQQQQRTWQSWWSDNHRAKRDSSSEFDCSCLGQKTCSMFALFLPASRKHQHRQCPQLKDFGHRRSVSDGRCEQYTLSNGTLPAHAKHFLNLPFRRIVCNLLQVPFACGNGFCSHSDPNQSLARCHDFTEHTLDGNQVTVDNAQ